MGHPPPAPSSTSSPFSAPVGPVQGGSRSPTQRGASQGRGPQARWDSKTGIQSFDSVFSSLSPSSFPPLQSVWWKLSEMRVDGQVYCMGTGIRWWPVWFHLCPPLRPEPQPYFLSHSHSIKSIRDKESLTQVTTTEGDLPFLQDRGRESLQPWRHRKVTVA